MNTMNKTIRSLTKVFCDQMDAIGISKHSLYFPKRTYISNFNVYVGGVRRETHGQGKISQACKWFHSFLKKSEISPDQYSFLQMKGWREAETIHGYEAVLAPPETLCNSEYSSEDLRMITVWMGR